MCGSPIEFFMPVSILIYFFGDRQKFFGANGKKTNRVFYGCSISHFFCRFTNKYLMVANKNLLLANNNILLGTDKKTVLQRRLEVSKACKSEVRNFSTCRNSYLVKRGHAHCSSCRACLFLLH